MVAYSYSARNLLSEPQHYMYAKFEGLAFLRSYISAREQHVGQVKGELTDIAAASTSALKDFSETASVEIVPLLQALIAEQLRNPHSKEVTYWWRKVVQQFEVSKRLYAAYGPGFKKGSGDYMNLEPYALLALSSTLHYRATGTLVALNVLLKLVDLLCSQPTQHPLLHLLVKTEMEFVRALAGAKGVVSDR